MRALFLVPVAARSVVVAAACAAALTLSSCTGCEPPVVDDPPAGPVGSVRLEQENGSATLVLVGLEQPLRAFQVDVDVKDGVATAFLPLADHDLVEAGLADAPAARFTAVVADTRKLPLNSGPLARLTVDEGATVTLTAAFGVDQTGKKRALTVVAR